MNKHYFISLTVLTLLLSFAVGCSRQSVGQQGSTDTQPGLTHSAMVQLDQIRQKYGVVINVREHQIIVGTPDLATKDKMGQIDNDLRNAFGNDFTNYTVVNVVD